MCMRRTMAQVVQSQAGQAGDTMFKYNWDVAILAL